MQNPATKQLEPVFDYISRHENRFLERLKTYLSMPSISAYGEGIAETAAYLADWLRELGMEAGLRETSGWPVVIGRRMDAPGKPTVLLYGHYDVQPPDPLEAWISPPFSPTVRNGRLYARGAGDNKGQHAAQLFALESLLAVHGRLPINVIFLLEGEEEVGSPNMPEVVDRYRRELDADLVIISDGPVDISGQSQLQFGVRGLITIELRARGANQDLHSGNWGGVVPNPIWTLVHLLSSMKNKEGEITIDGFYDDVEQPTDLEREALTALPIDIDQVMRKLELAELDAPGGRPFFDRLAFWPTFTINGIQGGYNGPGSKTVLPHEAVVKCDMRLVHNQSGADIFSKVEAHVRKHAPDVECIWLGGMDPSKTPLDSPFTAPIFRAITLAQGAEPQMVPAMGGSLPNYLFTKTLGLPTFVVPYANADEDNHAPNENIEVARIFMGIRTGASMLVHLAEMESVP